MSVCECFGVRMSVCVSLVGKVSVCECFWLGRYLYVNVYVCVCLCVSLVGKVSVCECFGLGM